MHGFGAQFAEVLVDPDLGAADYHLAANADVSAIEPYFVEEDDAQVELL
jgi:hypothetical protein